MINRLGLLSATTLGLIGAACFAQADDLKFHPITDGAVYVKPFTNLKGKWNNEYGISVPLITSGNAILKYNIGYVQTYPLAWKAAPQWTAGTTLVYEFDKSGNIKSGVYSKIKNNLLGVWQQESGYTARTRVGRYGIVFNAGYIWNYPYDSSAAPKWQLGLSLNYHFK